MENWKKRLEEQFVDDDGLMRMKYRQEELEDFISQELDKARGQGMLDEWGRLVGEYAYERKGDKGVFKGELRMSESDIKKEYERLDKLSGGVVDESDTDRTKEL